MASSDLVNSPLIGKWKLESEKKFQEFLYELGVSYMMRKGALLPMSKQKKFFLHL